MLVTTILGVLLGSSVIAVCYAARLWPAHGRADEDLAAAVPLAPPVLVEPDLAVCVERLDDGVAAIEVAYCDRCSGLVSCEVRRDGSRACRGCETHTTRVPDATPV